MVLPLFSYPVTIACVDDDTLFLKTLSQLLQKYYSIKSFTSAADSIQFFQKYSPILPNMNFLCGFTETDKYDMLNHLPIDLNVNALKALRMNQARQEDIAVLITDYGMPDLNGIALCRELAGQPMKKILLTGEADLQLAVTAFNEGIIDGYIRKDSPTLTDELIAQLQKFTESYLNDNTRSLRSHLETENSLALSDPAFMTFFKAWCLQHAVREYYLSDKYGNLVLLDDQGHESYFIIHTDRTLDNFVELHSDDNDAMNLVQSVKLREKIPYFGEGVEAWELSPDQWSECFYTPQIVEGIEKYYWAMCKI